MKTEICIKNLKTSKRGFSLVEMLVVIAVIGILSAIAVPVLTSMHSQAGDDLSSAECEHDCQHGDKCCRGWQFGDPFCDKCG